jgi:hypothetical protein
MSRMKDKKRAKRSSTLRIPGMKDVEGKIRLPEGEYLVKVHEVTEEEGTAAPYFKWKLMVAEGPKKGGILYFNTSLAVQALWNLRSLLEALGVDVPDDETEMDTDDFLGREMMVSVEHESYEGKKQSKIADFWPVGDGEKRCGSRGRRRRRGRRRGERSHAARAAGRRSAAQRRQQRRMTTTRIAKAMTGTRRRKSRPKSPAELLAVVQKAMARSRAPRRRAA